jgi:hypothetical protein
MRAARAPEALAPLLPALLAFALIAPHAAYAAAAARPAPRPDERRILSQPVDPATPIDHDGQPVPKPAERDPGQLAHLLHETLVSPLVHTFDVPDKILWALGPFGVHGIPESANVNDFDEVPNSTWFTNRNHMRALSPRQVREGPFGAVRPTPPFEIKSVKTSGINPGFNVKDAAGKRWVVKLDTPGHPQLSSGAGVVSSRLVWAAGYNVPHDEAFTFRREELKLDEDLVQGKDGKAPFRDDDLERLLRRGARGQDGRWYATASLFLPGTPVGPLSFAKKRADDGNDRYRHKNRRELRGLYVVYSWINNWDVKDHQSLDTYGPDSAGGHVTHYLLDLNGSLGASAEGPKEARSGFEKRVDAKWTFRRLVTLGFVEEPWRKARQESGIPSVGHFSSDRFEPGDWKPSQFVDPFRLMTDADGYWGAKIVASFTDAQIAGAVDAAGYEDPQVRGYLVRTLAERRDRIARYWFDRVAPLDFFQVEDGTLLFHDLAVDLGFAQNRSYRLEAEGGDSARGMLASASAESGTPGVRLRDLRSDGTPLRLKLSIVGSPAKPVRLELMRRGAGWTVTRVRHG